VSYCLGDGKNFYQKTNTITLNSQINFFMVPALSNKDVYFEGITTKALLHIQGLEDQINKNSLTESS
jgi:hypothetical protein